jgi:hypothetical protein
MIKTPLSTVIGGAFWTPGCTVISGNTPTFDQQIQKLFSNGEQGFVYDPNDLSTMFQNAVGTIPVTAAGQPVGLVLDKSGRSNHAYQTTSAARPILQQTPIFGNELFVNGDFATNDFAGWAHPDSAPSATTVANQQVTMTAAAGSTLARLRQSLSVTAGEYVVSLDVKSITGTPQLYLSMGNTASGDATYGEITCNRLGKYEQKITVAAGTLGLAFTAASINGGSIVIDDISVKRVTGYHTDQNYIDYDNVDDKLITNLPAQLTGCTVIRSVPNVGTKILTNQTIPTTYNDNTDHYGLIVVNRTLTPSETSAITSEFNKRAGV